MKHNELKCPSTTHFVILYMYLNPSSHTDSEPGEVAEEEDEDDGDEDQRRLLLPPPDVQLTTAHGGHRHPKGPSINDVHPLPTCLHLTLIYRDRQKGKAVC